MKSTNKFATLQDKKLSNEESFRGGSVPPDRPRRPTGGYRPPFGRGR